jgi:multimeric flavodoxin WrbA
MVAQVLGVAGSPRSAGNSTALLNEVLGIAREKGLNTEEVILNDLYFKGCQACLGCAEEGECVQADELQGVYAKLTRAKAWVFSAPILFDGVSGQMKLFLDRLYSLINTRKKLPGTHRAALILTYEAPRNEFYEQLAQRLGEYFQRLGTFDVVEALPISLGGSSQSIRERPEVMAQVKTLAEKIFVGMA